MELFILPENVNGLDDDAKEKLRKLLEVYSYTQPNNNIKERYYEGKITLNEVNLGIALPKGIAGLQIGCSWGAKTVDVLAGRSMFDGFVGENGEEVDELAKIVKDNNLIAEYPKACRDELKIGCSFITLSADDDIKCRIRFHSTRSASAIWDGEKGRIAYGMAILDTAPSNDNINNWTPSVIRLDTEDAMWILTRFEATWTAEKHPHKLGRPLIEPLVEGRAHV